MIAAILGDTHFGFRVDSSSYQKHVRRFYEEVFIPYLIEHKIDTVIQTGDFFDTRKSMNIKAIRFTKDILLDPLRKHNIKLITYAGNHDVFYKSTNSLYSVKEIISEKEYPNVRIIQDLVEEDGIAYVPWINKENHEDFMTWANKTSCEIAFGHFELSGFDFMKGVESKHGLSASTMKDIPLVISGHYHHKSRKGNIVYVGTAYEMTWSDYNDQKGFHILDTETKELTFVDNPVTLYHKIYYNDLEIDYDDFDYGRYKNTYVKVYVVNRNKDAMWDRFTDRLFKAGVIDANIIEQAVEYSDIDIEDLDVEDTTSILLRAAEEIPNVDTTAVKKLLQELQAEALTLSHE